MARRKSSSAVLNVNLTPLLDVVLQLITFFMMLVHFGTRLEGASRAVRLPLVPAALPGAELTFDRMPVLIDARGRLKNGDQWLEEDAAAAWWAEKARSRRAGLETLRDPRAADDELPTVVILRADRDASYGSVRRAMATAQERGFAHFSLIVLRRRAR